MELSPISIIIAQIAWTLYVAGATLLLAQITNHARLEGAGLDFSCLGGALMLSSFPIGLCSENTYGGHLIRQWLGF